MPDGEAAPTIGFGGLHSLIRANSFGIQYLAVMTEIGLRSNLTPACSIDSLHRACQAYREEYDRLQRQHRSKRAFLTAACTALVNSCAQNSQVTYSSTTQPITEVIPLDVFRIVQHRPNITTALVFGAVIYSVEKEKQSGKGPSCHLNLPLIVGAARGLHGQKLNSRGFLQFIGLRP